MTNLAIEMHLPRKGPAAVLSRVQRELPPPGRGQVRVAIEAAGVAYADIVVRQGLYKGVALPVTPGYDFVGRIESLGPEVRNFSVGQRVGAVTVVGSYASRRNVDVRWLVPAPEHADPAQLAAVMLNGLTAWQMFHRVANPERGEWVLVHGAAGGVGSLLLDLARLAGVRAIGTASAGKLSVVAARGGVPIDHGGGDVVKRVREIADAGVAAAFDHIGGRHFKRVTMGSLRRGGIGVLYGGYDATRGGAVQPLAILDLMLNTRFSSYALFGQGQGIVGYSAPAWRESRPQAYRTDLCRVLALVADGSLSPLIARTYPLEQAAEAQRALETRSVAGKIVLVNPGLAP
jgi:NADPH:quinone reductase-like Zn-dependent oxidoreductase